MNSGLGVVGVFVLAFGGTILFEALNNLLHSAEYGTSSIGVPPYDILGFIGFLFVGFGLWLIVQSGKSEMKEEYERKT
jgi:divalent metal cation (Fe/Co/Zn/Cd) transporter